MNDFWTEDLTEEETERLLDKAAEQVRKRRMEAPAILALEMHKPLAGFASHMMVATAPFTVPFFGYDNIHDMSRLLKDRKNVERLIQRLECPVKAEPSEMD